MPVNLCHAFHVDDEEVLMFVAMTCPIKGGRCCGDTCPQNSPKTHLHTPTTLLIQLVRGFKYKPPI